MASAKKLGWFLSIPVYQLTLWKWDVHLSGQFVWCVSRCFKITEGSSTRSPHMGTAWCPPGYLLQLLPYDRALSIQVGGSHCLKGALEAYQHELCQESAVQHLFVAVWLGLSVCVIQSPRWSTIVVLALTHHPSSQAPIMYPSLLNIKHHHPLLPITDHHWFQLNHYPSWIITSHRVTNLQSTIKQPLIIHHPPHSKLSPPRCHQGTSPSPSAQCCHRALRSSCRTSFEGRLGMSSKPESCGMAGAWLGRGWSCWYMMLSWRRESMVHWG